MAELRFSSFTCWILTMAALICDSFGKLCGSCCDVLTLPCKLCGECCSKVICSPFFPYLAVTMALNFPPAVWGLQAFGLQCDGSSWLWTNGALCIVHMVAAFYIVHKVQKHQHEEEILHYAQATVVGDVEQLASAAKKAAPTKHSSDTSYQRMGGAQPNIFEAVATAIKDHNNKGTLTSKAPVMATAHTTTTLTTHTYADGGHGAANSFQRLSRVLCYDPGVALYIVAAVVWLLWLTVGMSKVFVIGENGNGDNALCESTHKWILMSLTCATVYCSLVCFAFSCSLICMR
jgi:hypothetical protein